MNEEIIKKYVTKPNDCMNVFLFLLTLINSIVFIKLFIDCFTFELGTNYHSLALGMCGVFASLASAFFIAWIIRWHDRKKKEKQERKSLKLLYPYVNNIFVTMNKYYPCFKYFVTIDNDGRIKYSKNIIYYKDTSISEENRSFVLLDDLFSSFYSKLNKNIDDCINLPIIYQCNEEIVDLITRLKLNKFSYNLLKISKTSKINSDIDDLQFVGLYDNYKEFKEIYEIFSNFVSYNRRESLVELNEYERMNYINEIEIIKKQIPYKHDEEIYLGRIRIQ